jgi:O-antigen ligase
MLQTVTIRQLPAWGLAALLVLPWLGPYTSGPTPNAWPWLISALCAVILWLFRRRLNGELIAAAWVLAATLSAVIGLVQYFGLAPALSPWVSQTEAGEAFANLRQRNQFATLTSIGLVALMGGLARRTPEDRVPWWAHALVWLLALGNAASSSRTGFLQWALILALTAWWAMRAVRSRRRLVVFALQAVLAYVIAVVTLPWLLSIFTGVASGGLLGRLAETPGCGSRKVLWSNVLTLIAQKPGLGWGWGELDYAHFITLYPGPRFCEILDNAHNLPLQLAVELGLPVALAICTGLAWIVWRAKPWRETDAARQMAWGVLAVIGLHSLLEYPLWYGPFQLAVALCAGLLWATSSALVSGAGQAPAPDFPQKYKKNKALAQYLRELAAITMIALLVSAGIDYHRVSQIYLPPEQRSAAYRDDALSKIQGAWLFRDQARFATLNVTPLNRDNAQWTFDTAAALLHYSPEPRVIEKLIESATLLGRDEEALRYLARYRAAFPEDHARWAREHVIR